MYRRAYWPNEGQRSSPKTYSPTPEGYKKSIDPQDSDREGKTALHQAILQGRDDDLHLQRVLKAGCHVDVTDKSGSCGLHYAAEKGYTRCIQKMVKYGACLNPVNKCGYTPLMLAARHGFPKAVRALIRAGANINQENDKSLEQALHYAVCKGHLECVEDLLTAKCNVDRPNAEGSTPLILATKFEHLDVMDTLVRSGAKLDMQDSIGRTALHWLATVGSVEMARLLLDAGATTDKFDIHGLSPFVYTIQMNNPSLMRCLIDSGCDRNTVDGLNGTALVLACLKGHTECVKQLLETDDDPDEIGFFGLTPLMAACFESHVGTVKTLLSFGADPNMKGRMGATALVKSLVRICNRNDCERHRIVAMLLRAGADVNARVSATGYFTPITNGKNCPLSFALCSGYTSLIQMLLVADCKVSCSELREWTQKEQIDKFYDKSALFQPLCDWKHNPRSLKHLSRMVVRNNLRTQGWGISRDIQVLPIAPAVKEYVDFGDLDDFVPENAGPAQPLDNVQASTPLRVCCPSALRALEGTFIHQTVVGSH